MRAATPRPIMTLPSPMTVIVWQTNSPHAATAAPESTAQDETGTTTGYGPSGGMVSLSSRRERPRRPETHLRHLGRWGRTVTVAGAGRAAVHGAGRQTLLVFVLVWSATQATARNAPAGLSVVNSHRGRLQMPLQKAATLRDLCPARGAGPAWVSSASLSIAVIVT